MSVMLSSLNYLACIFLSHAGSVDPASVLEQIELQISQVKEQAFSRIEILEKVDKWLSACDEESWLEEYSRVSFFFFFFIMFLSLYLCFSNLRQFLKTRYVNYVNSVCLKQDHTPSIYNDAAIITSNV
jgi:hypothetical protein